MIRVTVRDIINASQSIQELAAYDFNASIAFKIARIIYALNLEMENINKIRCDIFNKYAERDAQGKIKLDSDNIQIKKECVPQYNQEMSDLFKTEIDISVDPIHIEDLGNMSISPNKLIALQRFIIQ